MTSRPIFPERVCSQFSALDEKNAAAGRAAREKGAEAQRSGITIFHDPVADRGPRTGYRVFDIEKLDGPPIAKFDSLFELEEYLIGYEESKREKRE